MLSVAYPIAIFFCCVIFRVPIKILSLCIIFLALVYLLLATGKKRDGKKFFVSASILLLCGTICFFTGKSFFIKLYPVAMNGIFLFMFASTLFFPPNMCFRFALLGDKTLEHSPIKQGVERYCKKVTVVWCVFFVLNGLFALITVFSNNDRIWSVYNGGIAYGLIGAIFAVEFLVRKRANSKMMNSIESNPIPISKFTAKCRPMDTVLCYEQKWSEKKYLTWGDFLRDSAKMRSFLESRPEIEKWILHCEDYWLFLCSFVALLQMKKEVLLTANISVNFIEEIRNPDGLRNKFGVTDSSSSHAELVSASKTVSASKIGFLTDQTGQKNSVFIPSVIEESAEPSEEEILRTPEINPGETKIVMYTSGSTGHPKAVRQRMTEFEADNAFIISKWGGEFCARKLLATVSQHHIYGFLFTICLPFTLAVPFRRRRIEFPEEFEGLDDESYMIIAVPAFLKRTVQGVRADGSSKRLPLKNPWIFTSGGAVSPELAVDTENVFGFCPLEVYGSTETSGIAYRQQTADGLLWTPFDNARIWTDKDDGCLTIISPYIKDPAGFKTGDLAEIRADGKFILKGRADSIVKIEEKRISVVEMESRIMQTGLVQDVCVVPMSDRRQYLAAAVVLNADGKEKFSGTEKFLVNRYFHDFLMQFFENVVIPKKWRYLDVLPTDVQGKKHKPEIQALFAEKS